ncbi:acylphosphatase [Planctomycetota bacterium]
MTDIAKRIVFHGRVQGVGFRYITCRVAAKYPITGYVKNMPGGTVECVACGSDENVKAFIDDICRTMSDNISRKTTEDLNILPDYKLFDITY